ncbi:hypothetical protein ABPG75_001809 [Micractinium tetrahymenae]
MPPVLVWAAWLGLWALVRLLCSLPALSALGRRGGVDIEREWWRVTVRYSSSSAGGLASGLGAQKRHWLRRWFSLGAVAGLVAACASVALLAGELRALLRPPAAAAGAAAAAESGPRLQLALPGITLPGSHATPLWLALAASLAAHEAGHALAAAAEGVQVSGAGLSLLLLLPAAFVELDCADLGRLSMLRVATAGVWHNTALGLACWAALAALPGDSNGGGGGGVGTTTALAPAAGALLVFVRLLLGYTVSLSAALALLNMAPVHFLDGQQALEALVLRPRRAAKELPAHAEPGDGGASSGGSGGKSRRAAAVRWVLHAGTAAYVAVVLLHLQRVRWGS